MPTGSRSDPLVGYHFHVEIDGVSQAQVDAMLRDTPRRFLTGEK